MSPRLRSLSGENRDWLRVGGPSRTVNIVVNGVGAVATGATLLVVLVAKFAEGAWVTMILVPLLLATFVAVRRHYHAVSMKIANPHPLDARNIQPPIVIVPMREWNKMSQKGLRFALKLSPDIFVVQVRAAEKGEDDLARRWEEYVETPTKGARLAVPHLVELPSPYRHVFNPLIDYVFMMKREHPDRQIAVLIPELVTRRWYHHLLHNKRAAMPKTLLLLRGDEDIVVINVPWYLSA